MRWNMVRIGCLKAFFKSFLIDARERNDCYALFKVKERVFCLFVFCQQRVTFVYVEIKWKENTSRGCRLVSKEQRKYF